MEFSRYCDYPDPEDWPGWLNFDDCNTYEIIEKIKVINSQKVKSTQALNRTYPTIKVAVELHFSSIFPSVDFSDFFISLAYRINQKYKVIVDFVYLNLTNTNINKEW